MFGRNTRLQALGRKEAPHIIWIHRTLHRQVLASGVRSYRLYLKLLSELLTMSETVH